MKLMVMTGIYIVLKKIDEIQEISTAERDKRNELSTKYNRWVNSIRVIDNCLRVTAIGFGITGVGLLSTFVAAPAAIGIEAVSIFMGLVLVVENQAIKKLSLKIEKLEKFSMSAVLSFNTIFIYLFFIFFYLKFLHTHIYSIILR